MGLFGKKNKPEEGKTILLLDVESGSVGAALVRISPHEAPKLFGEHRQHLPVAMSRSGASLAQEVERALGQAIHSVAEVASRIRQKFVPLGTVEQAAVFMAPPWGRPNLEKGRPDFLDLMTHTVHRAARAHFGEVPTAFYTSAGLAGFGTRTLLGPEPALVCVVSGELTELLHMDEEGVRAHATVPLGSHALARTLRTHGGLSLEEARSASALPFETPHLREPFAAAADHYGQALREAARDMFQKDAVSRVRVVAPEPLGAWFARALAEHATFSELFSQGEIRALKPRHASAHLNAHAPKPDLALMLGALFVDSLQ